MHILLCRMHCAVVFVFVYLLYDVFFSSRFRLYEDSPVFFLFHFPPSQSRADRLVDPLSMTCCTRVRAQYITLHYYLPSPVHNNIIVKEKRDHHRHYHYHHYHRHRPRAAPLSLCLPRRRQMVTAIIFSSF